MIAVGYTRGEVAFLLSLQDHQAAIEYATRIGSALGRLDQADVRHASPDESDVPVIARWVEVHRARDLVVTRKRDRAVLQLRCQGLSEREVAEALGMGRRTVGRQFRATLEEVLGELGGAYERPETRDHVDACMSCGERPRGRMMHRQRYWTGARWRFRMVEARASVCLECADSRAA